MGQSAPNTEKLEDLPYIMPEAFPPRLGRGRVVALAEM